MYSNSQMVLGYVQTSSCKGRVEDQEKPKWLGLQKQTEAFHNALAIEAFLLLHPSARRSDCQTG